MAFEEEKIEIEIRFVEEDDEIPVANLTQLLSRLEQTYIAFQNNKNIIEDISPPKFDQEIFYDDDSRDMFIGRLQRYGVLSDIEFRPSPFRVQTVHYPTNYDGLQVSRIQKESPLVISLIGGGTFAAVLWIIAGVEIEFDWEKQVDAAGNESKDVQARFRFDATSTRELINAISDLLE